MAAVKTSTTILGLAALGLAGGIYIATQQGSGAPVSIRAIPVPTSPRPAGIEPRAAEATPAELGTLWHLAGTATRPRRPISPITRPTNYSEGPSGIIHPDGTLSLLINSGACCDVPTPWGPGFEGLARLHLPDGGWTWTGTCNNAGANPELDEHEMGYGSWLGTRGWYVSTRWSTHDAGPFHRVNVGAATGNWGGAWTRNPEALKEDGVIQWVVAAVQSATDTWVYVREQRETSQVCVRHKVMGNGALGSGQATSWEGYAIGSVPDVTDMAMVGGEWRALAAAGTGNASPWTWNTIAEWRSVAESGMMGETPAGVIWRPTGRTITSPFRTIWDPGYIRTETGTLASGVVLMVCGDGQWADTGAWEICAWQPQGVAIPPALAPMLEPVTGPPVTPTPAPTSAPTPTAGPTPPPTPSPTATPTPAPEPCGGALPARVVRWDNISPAPTGVLIDVTTWCAGGELWTPGRRYPLIPGKNPTLSFGGRSWAVVSGAVDLRAKSIQGVGGREIASDIAVVLVPPCETP